MTDQEIYSLKHQLPTISSGKDEDEHITEDTQERVDITENVVVSDNALSDNDHAKYHSVLDSIKDKHPSDIHVNVFEKYKKLDDEVHSMFKRGIPSGEEFHEIEKKIDDHPFMGEYDQAAGQLVHNKYLSNWNLMRHIRKEPTEFSKEEAYLTPHEIRKHSKDFRFVAGRLMRSNYSDSDNVYELHPSGKISLTNETSPKSFFQNTYHPIQTDKDYPEIKKLDGRLTDSFNKHTITPGLFNAVKKYTDHSTNINKSLALHHKKELFSMMLGDERHQNNYYSKKLTDGMREHPPHPESITVYSGLSRSTDFTHPTGHVDSDGKKLHYGPAFLSTSIKASTAESFSKPKHDPLVERDIHDIAEINIPPNYKHGIYVEPISSNKGEFEYVLNKGHAFKVHPEPKYYINRIGKIMRHWKVDLVEQNDEEGNADLTNYGK